MGMGIVQQDDAINAFMWNFVLYMQILKCLTVTYVIHCVVILLENQCQGSLDVSLFLFRWIHHLVHNHQMSSIKVLFLFLPLSFILCRLFQTLYGFGGIEVACWPLVPKFAGSNPAEAVGFLRAKKSSACLPSEGK